MTDQPDTTTEETTEATEPQAVDPQTPRDDTQEDPSTQDVGENAEPQTTEPTPAVAQVAPAAAVKPAAKVTKAQQQHLADALVADLRRQLVSAKKKIDPKQLGLLERVADRAIAYRIKAAIGPTNARQLAKLDAERKAIEAQLANLKAAAAVITAKRLWSTIDAIVSRLTSFAIGAAVAAV